MMRNRRSGKIINICVAGFSTSPAFSAYNASKWALEAFSKVCAMSWPYGGPGAFGRTRTYKTKIFSETRGMQKF